MPDLQSELNKILTQQQFDDDDGKKPATVVADNPKELPQESSARLRAWNYIKDHPDARVGDIAAAIGATTPGIAGGLHKMVINGHLTRTSLGDGSGYRYRVVGDSYNVLTAEQRVEMMRKAHRAFLDKRASMPKVEKKPKAKVKKPKAKPIKWVQDKPKAPAPAAFDADAIIAGLTVLQAKELLVKLKEVFGV